MSLKLITAPSIEPVTADEAKDWLRLDGDDEDDTLDLLIATAREYAESFQNRAYLTQAWRLTLDAFPRDCRGGDKAIVLPRPPLISITSVAYVDTAGDSQTLAAGTGYQLESDAEPARIWPAYGTCWPSTRCQPAAVTVTYSAGYGAAATAVPNRVKQSMRLLIAHWFENREAVGSVGEEIAIAVHALLTLDRVVPV